MANAGFIRLIRGAGIDPGAYRQVRVASELPLGPPGFCARRRGSCSTGYQGALRLGREADWANPASASRPEVDAWVDEGVVEFWGWQQDMPSVFAQAQIVCPPSYHEGLPKSLLEAAASGCAIVATDIPGCREIVQQGAGWFVPAQDARALAIALQQAIEQPSLREQYGFAARALIVADFSMSRVASDTITVYDELIADAAAQTDTADC